MKDGRHLTIHLASGQSFITGEYFDELLDDEEILLVLKDRLSPLNGDARPGWRIIGDVLVFSQIVSAIEID